jgi:hypothetical protein
MWVRKFADMHREFAGGAPARGQGGELRQPGPHGVGTRKAISSPRCFMAAARWPIFENNEKSTGYTARMVACYDRFAALMKRPDERVSSTPRPGRCHGDDGNR